MDEDGCVLPIHGPTIRLSLDVVSATIWMGGQVVLKFVLAGLALLAALGAQLAQSCKSPLVALAPAADAVAHPVFFHGDLAVDLVTLDLLLRENLVAPVLECGETPLEPSRLPAVKPNGPARQVFEKAPVVADQHQRAVQTG